MNRDETPNWMVTKGPDGERILDPERNKENVASYYEDLYKNKNEPCHPYHFEVIDHIKRLSDQDENEEEELNEINRIPTEKEVEAAN